MSLSRPKANANRLKNARILIIEDNPDHLFLMRNAIQQSFTDAEPIMATNGDEAVQYLDECLLAGLRLPQFILLDLYLPERENGWQVLKTIKSKDSEIAQIPVLVFSNSTHNEDISESYDRGATSYIIKPTDFEEWVTYFQILKDYWWETATLPNSHSTH
ncbi:response regulator [Larkinella harenae]